MKKYIDFLKKPLSDGNMNLVSCITVFIGSIFVNAYFLRTSFSSIVDWFMSISKDAVTPEAQQSILDIVNTSNGAVASKIAFGLLMTVFIMIFLLPSAYLESGRKEKNFVKLYKRACSTMFVPVIFMLLSALLMNISFVCGLILAITAAAVCVSIIVKAGRKSNVNDYLIIITVALFFLITVALCTRNHFVTMFG